jgi:predicted RNA-binding protein YlxR (DUF448 family)
MQRRRHVPQRTCIVCRKKKDKRRLIRIVRDSETGVFVDLTGKHKGRGAYLCQEHACWDKALNSEVLDQALRIEISVAEKEKLVESISRLVPTN